MKTMGDKIDSESEIAWKRLQSGKDCNFLEIWKEQAGICLCHQKVDNIKKASSPSTIKLAYYILYRCDNWS